MFMMPVVSFSGSTPVFSHNAKSTLHTGLSNDSRGSLGPRPSLHSFYAKGSGAKTTAGVESEIK